MRKFIVLLTLIALCACVPTINGYRQITPQSYVEQSLEDEHTRTYHVKYKDNPSVGDFYLFIKLLGIEGVQNVIPIPYQPIITKAPIYTWDEIEPKIIEIIKEFERLKAKEETEPVAAEPDKSKGI